MRLSYRKGKTKHNFITIFFKYKVGWSKKSKKMLTKFQPHFVGFLKKIEPEVKKTFSYKKKTCSLFGCDVGKENQRKDFFFLERSLGHSKSVGDFLFRISCMIVTK